MTGSTLIRTIVLNRILPFLFIVFAVFGVVSVAHAQYAIGLCESQWLRGATGDEVRELVRQGNSANRDCAMGAALLRRRSREGSWGSATGMERAT